MDKEVINTDYCECEEENNEKSNIVSFIVYFI